jgi:hypothetical protein
MASFEAAWWGDGFEEVTLTLPSTISSKQQAYFRLELQRQGRKT